MLAVWGMLNPIAVAGGNFSIINSIQQVSITIASAQTSGTATITGVSAANTILIWGGITGTDSVSNLGLSFSSIVLTNGTTITAEKQGPSNPAVTVKLTAVEFATSAIDNIQTGSIVIATAAATASAVITSVVLADALCHYNGAIYTTTANAGEPASIFSALQLTSPTNIDCGRGSKASSSQLTTYYSVVRFKPGVLNQSTQQINIPTSANTALATITSAGTGSTAIFYGGFMSSGANLRAYSYMKQDNATQIQALNGNAVNTRITGTVVNFKSTNVKSVNRKLLAISTAAASVTDTITSVVAAKSYVQYLGHKNPNATETTAMNTLPVVTLDTPTTVLAEMTKKFTAGANPITIISYEAIEFY